MFVIVFFSRVFQDPSFSGFLCFSRTHIIMPKTAMHDAMLTKYCFVFFCSTFRTKDFPRFSPRLTCVLTLSYVYIA